MRGDIPSSTTAGRLAVPEPRQRDSSGSTWVTTSGGEMGPYSDADDGEDRAEFVREYNRLAKKYGVQPLELEEVEATTPSEHSSDQQKRGWFSRTFLRQPSAASQGSSGSSAKSEKRIQRRRSVSDLAVQIVHPKKDALKDEDLETLVRICGRSRLYLPSEYAPTTLTLPTCFRATAQYLIQHGANTPGLFRIPGSARAINALYDYYCVDQDAENISSTIRSPHLPSHIRAGVHDVASTFKRLLAGLPGGILGYLPLYDALVAIHNQLQSHPELSKSKLIKLRARLIALAIGTINSRYRREMVCAVFGLLSLVGRAAEKAPRADDRGRPLPTSDLMGYSALGIIFGPLLVGDLLSSYNPTISNPALAATNSTPTTPTKPKKERPKSKATDEPTPFALGIDKIRTANGVAEMMISHWRESVGHMRALGVLSRGGDAPSHPSQAQRQVKRLRPYASEFFAKLPPEIPQVPSSLSGVVSGKPPPPQGRPHSNGVMSSTSYAGWDDVQDALMINQNLAPPKSRPPSSGGRLSGVLSLPRPSQTTEQTLVGGPRSHAKGASDPYVPLRRSNPVTAREEPLRHSGANGATPSSNPQRLKPPADDNYALSATANSQPPTKSSVPRQQAEITLGASSELEASGATRGNSIPRQPSYERLQGRVRARKPVPSQTVFDLFDLQDDNPRTTNTPKSVNFSRPSTHATSQPRGRQTSSSKSSREGSTDSWSKREPRSHPTPPGSRTHSASASASRIAGEALATKAPAVVVVAAPVPAGREDLPVHSLGDDSTSGWVTPGGRKIPTPRKSWPFSEETRPPLPSAGPTVAANRRMPVDPPTEPIPRQTPEGEHRKAKDSSLPADSARREDVSRSGYQSRRKHDDTTASYIPMVAVKRASAPPPADSSRGPSRTSQPEREPTVSIMKTSKGGSAQPRESGLTSATTVATMPPDVSPEHQRRVRRHKSRQTLREAARDPPETPEKQPSAESAPNPPASARSGGSAVKAITALFEKASHDSFTTPTAQGTKEARADDPQRRSVVSMYATNTSISPAKSERSSRSSSAKPSSRSRAAQRYRGSTDDEDGQAEAEVAPRTIIRPKSSPGALAKEGFSIRPALKKQKPATGWTPTRPEARASSPPPHPELPMSPTRRGRGRRRDASVEGGGGGCRSATATAKKTTVSSESPLRGSTVLHSQIVSLKKELEGRSEQIAHLRRQVETKSSGGSDVGALSEQLQASKKECTAWRARAEAAEKRAAALERRLCSSRPSSGGGGCGGDENSRWSIYASGGTAEPAAVVPSYRSRDSKEMRRSVGERTGDLYGQEHLGHGAGIWTAAQAFLG